MIHDILQIFILSFFIEFKVTELAVGISLGIVLVVITIAAVSYYKCRVYSYKMKYTVYDKVKTYSCTNLSFEILVMIIEQILKFLHCV